MTESGVRARRNSPAVAPIVPDREEAAILAAALAATLLEYRRQVVDSGSHGGKEHARRDGWRMVGRWEQLRGAS